MRVRATFHMYAEKRTFEELIYKRRDLKKIKENTHRVLSGTLTTFQFERDFDLPTFRSKRIFGYFGMFSK